MWTLVSATAAALHEANKLLCQLELSVPQIFPAYSIYDVNGAFTRQGALADFPPL